MRKEYDNIRDILMNKEMESKEMTGNKKKINIYHTNLTKQRYLQTEQPQAIKILDTDTEPKDKESENQPKKLEGEVNIKYTRENIKRNKRKDSTEKCGKNRVQNIEEWIEDVVEVEIRSIQAKPKQQEHDEVANEVSNSQLQKKNVVR